MSEAIEYSTSLLTNGTQTRLVYNNVSSDGDRTGIVIVKVGTDGTTQWVKEDPSFNGSGYDVAPSVALDADGNLYLAYSRINLGEQPGVIDFAASSIIPKASIVPDIDASYSLGSQTTQFKDLYLSGDLYVGGSPLILNDGSNVILKNNMGNVVLEPTNGYITLNGNTNISGGIDVSGSASIDGDLSIGANLNIASGNITNVGDITSSGAINGVSSTLTDKIIVSGTTNTSNIQKLEVSNLTVTGTFIQSGTTETVTSTEVSTGETYLRLNDIVAGESFPTVGSNFSSGVIINLSGGTTPEAEAENYAFVFHHNSQSFRVGQKGSNFDVDGKGDTQAVATRLESDLMDGGAVAIWNKGYNRFECVKGIISFKRSTPIEGIHTGTTPSDDPTLNNQTAGSNTLISNLGLEILECGNSTLSRFKRLIVGNSTNRFERSFFYKNLGVGGSLKIGINEGDTTYSNATLFSPNISMIDITGVNGQTTNITHDTITTKYLSLSNITGTGGSSVIAMDEGQFSHLSVDTLLIGTDRHNIVEGIFTKINEGETSIEYGVYNTTKNIQLGVNVEAPTASLHIAGDLNIEDGNIKIKNTAGEFVAPSFKWLNDITLNNGIYYIEETGSDSTGNVGIGIMPNSTDRLLVSGNELLKGNLVVEGTTSLQNVSVADINSSGNATITGDITVNGSINNAGVLSIQSDTSIYTGKNLAIGATSGFDSTIALHVVGEAKIDNALVVGGLLSASSIKTNTINDSDDNVIISRLGTSTDYKLGGNIGIGANPTTDVSSNLTVGSDGVYIIGDLRVGGSLMKTDGTSFDFGSPLRYINNDQTKTYFDTSGGIRKILFGNSEASIRTGLDDPTVQIENGLSVTGRIILNGLDVTNGVFRYNYDNTNSGADVNEAFYLGNVGIGLQNPSVRLDVSGDANFSNGVVNAEVLDVAVLKINGEIPSFGGLSTDTAGSNIGVLDGQPTENVGIGQESSTDLPLGSLSVAETVESKNVQVQEYIGSTNFIKLTQDVSGVSGDTLTVKLYNVFTDSGGDGQYPTRQPIYIRVLSMLSAGTDPINNFVQETKIYGFGSSSNFNGSNYVYSYEKVKETTHNRVRLDSEIIETGSNTNVLGSNGTDIQLQFNFSGTAISTSTAAFGFITVEVECANRTSNALRAEITN